MFSLLAIVFFTIGLCKLTGVIFRVLGRAFGIFLGIVGFLILGALAVSVLGAAMYVLPILLGVGIVALIAES